MTTKLPRPAVALVALALLVPAAADARPGKDNGHGHGRPAWAGPPTAAAPDARDVRTQAADEPAEAPVVEEQPGASEPAPEAPVGEPVAPAPKGHGRLKPKTFVFHGRVVTVDAAADTVDVLVRKGNARGRRFRGEVVTFALGSAVVEAVESDGAAGITAGDVLVDDAVVVQARLAQGARPDGTVLAARKLVDLAEREPAPVAEPVIVAPEPEAPAEDPAVAG